MAVAFRSVSSTTYASRTNCTVTAPASIANDDILLATIFVGSSSTTVPSVTPPSGFTLLQEPSNSTNDGGFYGKLRIYWKRAASESGSYTFNHTTASSQCAMLAISGAETVGSPIDAFSSNAVNVGGAAPTTATGITTTVANTLLCFLVHDWTATGALSPPTGFTEHSDSLVYTASKVQTATGATGNVTQNNGNPGGAGPWSAYLVAIKPPSGPTNVSTTIASVPAMTASTTTPIVMLPTTIQVRSVSSTTYAQRTDTVITPPSGIADNDILLAGLFVVHGTVVPTVTPQGSGWTQLSASPIAIDTGNGSAYGKLFVWWKRASSESGNYGWTHTFASSQMIMLAIKNAKASGDPIDVVSTNSATNGSTTTALSITTTAANDLVVNLSSNWGNSVGALTPPTGWTEQFDGVAYMATKLQPNVGATGNAVQANGNLATNEPWAAYQIGILETTTSGNVTVNASGNSASISAGNVSVPNVGVKLTGNSATISAGSVTVSTPVVGVGPVVKTVDSTAYAFRVNTTFSAPTGLANDDIMIAAIFVSDTAFVTEVTPPTGWDILAPRTQVSDGTVTAKLFVFGKRALSESGSYTFTHTSANAEGAMIVVSGAVTSGVSVEATSSNTRGGGSITTTVATGVTTNFPNDLLLYIAHDWQATGTLSPPTGFTERMDHFLYVADKTQPEDGTTGNVTQTNGNPGGAAEWAAFLLAIRPPAPTGGPEPVFRSLTSNSYTSRTNTTIAAPAGLADNDILLAGIFVGNAGASGSAPTVTPPTGFTALTGSPISMYDGGFSGKLNIFWKRASGEVGSYGFTHTVCNSQGVLMAFSGAATSGSPIDVSSTNFANTGNVSTALSVTTTKANDLLVYLGNDWQGSGGLSPPNAFAEILDSLIYSATKIKYSATPTGTITMPNNNPSTGLPWSANLIALMPPTSGSASTNVSGNSMAISAGSVTVNAATNISSSPGGNSMTISTGGAVVALPRSVDVATNFATISTSTPTVSLPCVVNASGSSATISTSDVTPRYAYAVSVTSPTMIITTTTPDVLAGGAISVGQSGNSMAISTSNVTATAIQNVSTTLTTNFATFTAGTVTARGAATASPGGNSLSASTSNVTVNTAFDVHVSVTGPPLTIATPSSTFVQVINGFEQNPALSYSIHAAIQSPSEVTTATINTGLADFVYPNPFQFQDWSSNDTVVWVFAPQMRASTGTATVTSGFATIMVTSPQMTMSLGATFVTGVAQPRPPEKEGRMLALTNMMGS